ncbi:MAG: hypothetical protein AABY95_11995 [Pseudomonadota bacterium]
MKNLFLLALALAALSALFVWMRPASTPVAVAVQPVVVTPASKTFELIVRDQRLLSGDAVLKVSEGERVVLRVTTDHADELHLHGYDLSLKLKANVPGELKFIAGRSGRFDFELHHSHVDLGALEVAPK